MNCYLHADRQAELHCAACGNLICEQCDVVLADHHVCKQCLANAESVPPQMSLAARSEPAALALFNRINFGMLSAAVVIGGIMGIVGAGMLRGSHRLDDFIAAISAAAFAGFVTYVICALIVRMIVPGHTVNQKGGVLGVFGISDFGLFACLILVAMAIGWALMG